MRQLTSHSRVGKEELVGLIRALGCFVEEDQDERRQEWLARTSAVTDGLANLTGIQTTMTTSEKTAVAPEVIVAVETEKAGASATAIVGALRREDPRVFVGANRLPDNE